MAVIFSGITVLAVEPHPCCEECHVRVIRGYGPAVAVATQYLEGVKTPAASQSPCTSHSPLACPIIEHARTQTLTGILHNDKVMPFRDLPDPDHVRHIAAQVHRDDPPRPECDSRLDQAAVYVEIPAHIHQHRGRPCIHHSGAGGYKGMGRYDHLVSWPDSRSQKGEVESVVAAVQANGVFRSHELRQVLLEPPQL